MTDAHTPDMRIPVTIAGREVNARPLTSEMLVSLQMAESDQIADGVKLKVISELFLSLMPTEDDRGHLMLSFATQQFTMADLTATLKRIATAPQVDVNAPQPTATVVPPRARKAAAKKATKRS